MANHFADIEADGLLHPWEPEAATCIDCMCVLTEDKRAGQPVEWCTEVGQGWMPREKDYVVFHNGFDYDLPVLQKFWGWEYDIFPDRLRGVHVEFVDTMLLSKLLNPDRTHPEGYAEQWKPAYPGQGLPGPHSLDAWAFRLGMKKPQLVYGDKMGNVPHEISVAQCKADVEITRGVYYALMAEAKQWNLKLRKPLKIEQGVRHIITQGAAHGVWFDTEKAEQCIPDLDAKMAELAERVEPQLPRRSVPASKVKLPPKQKFKKDGTPTALTQKYFGDALRLFDYRENEIPEEKQEWVVVTLDDLMPLKDWPADKPFGDNTEPMTMGNLGDIKQWLMDEHGWKPTIWNTKKGERGKKERTSPKLQQQGKLCEDLQRLGDLVPVVKDIVLWLSYRNRRSVIRSENGTGWLNHPRLALDHCLPADADTMGTGTFRFTHRVVANIPRKSSVYGEEMRSLFKPPPGKVCVGWDASQLEDRCKAHYCAKMPGGAEYIQKILDPDFDSHTENAEAWDVPRTVAKGGGYAMQYGCSPPKLAEILGVPAEKADEYHAAWWKNNEALACLLDEIKAVWQQHDKKWLPGLDGRLVPTRYEHSLANTIMQSAGIIAMKWAMVYWWLEVRKRGLDAVQVISYHDEEFCVCSPEIAEEVGELGVWSIKKAGEVLNFRVPLLSEYKIGESWLDVH